MGIRLGFFPLLLLLLVGCSPVQQTASLSAEASLPPALSPASCPVTEPNGSTPPGEQPSANYHGNGEVWVALWLDGKIVFTPGGPGEMRSDGSLAMKFPFWRGVRGKLEIEGRRLDGDAPPLSAEIPDGYGADGFQASALVFPTPGCWEVTARAGSGELEFVVLVVKE